MVNSVDKILILGASGFIGRELVRELVRDYHIVGVDREPASEEFGENFTFIKLDITDCSDFATLLDGVSKVIHLISCSVPMDTVDNSISELENDVIPLLRLLDAVCKSEVKEFVFASSAGTVYGDTGEICSSETAKNPICSYGIKKSVSEDYIKLYQRYGLFKGKIIRISNPYGLDGNTKKSQGVIPIFIRKLLKQEPITIYGDTLRDYIYMDDLITGMRLVIESDADLDVFQICSGVSYRLSEVTDLIEKVSGQKFTNVQLESPRGCDVMINRLDGSEMEVKIGWTATYNLERGVKKIFIDLKLGGGKNA